MRDAPISASPPSSPDALKQFLSAAVGAADAVATLHQSGIIHQNIRPQTLRIDPRGQGIELTGADMDQSSAPLALSLPIEALPYIAPEQTGRIEGAIDHRVDLYSLGIVLYELRAGSLPFHANDAVGWVHCHIARAPRPLTEAAPGTPKIVADILMRLLAKSPDDRYQSALGLGHDLRRCLSELTENWQIEPFPLGSRDIWDKLRIANRLYGRAEQLAVLRGAEERIRTGGRVEVVLLSGPSGIGKSVLVRELARSSGGASVAFLSGKFEENSRDIPYATLGHAFQDLIRQSVASTDAELAAIREQLTAALGGNGQLIIDVIPQVQLVLGEQPAVPPLPAADARNRFHLAFRSFLNVLATRERPLVLFLDDMQWADIATLELLQHVVTHPDVRSLLLVGACRDDEMDPSHPLEATLSEIRSAGLTVTSLKLGPLTQDDVVRLVLDLFNCDRDEAKPLADLLWTKASGNPFFVVQLLGSLYQEQLIRFDARKWTWQWDIAEIESKAITDDLVELVLSKFRRLPDSALDVLMLAACIGSEFSVQMLAALSAKTREEVRGDLEPALRDGLLLQRPEGYKFLHNRVLQAAYSLIPADERPGLHLRLGWMLLEHIPHDAIDRILFDIVNQLNLGVECVEEPGERRRIAQLNLFAGRKAKAAIATKSAARYLAMGLSLLPADAWDTDYALTYPLHLEMAECTFATARFEEAERICALVIERARNEADRAAAYHIQIELATVQLDSARAVEAALTCLRRLGVDLPADPSAADVLAEINGVREMLRDRAIEDLLDLPKNSDPNMAAATDILSTSYPGTVYVKPNLARILCVRTVQLSIVHGNTPASAYGYVVLGNLLCQHFGSFHEGYRFGKLATDLAMRPGFSAYKAEAVAMFGANILVWARPLKEAIDSIRLCFRYAQDSGKVMFAAMALVQMVMHLFAAGERLDAIHEVTVQAHDFATNLKFPLFVDNATLFQRFIYSLRGDTERFGSLSGEGFEEEAFETHLRERSIPLIRFFYFIYKLQARYFASEFKEARAAADAAEDLLWSGLYTIVEGELCFYAALTVAALCEGGREGEGEREREGEAAERASLKTRLAGYEEKLRVWAESSPDTFSCRHALVAAEIARIGGRSHDAIDLYDRAIRESREQGFVPIEGLACELAGRFHLKRSFAVLPAAYLREARACYVRWGARGKVRQLDALYPTLLAEPRRESVPTASVDVEPIDTLTAAKASTAISSEMAPEDLLATLMRILTEHAGAQRACLLLPSQNGLNLAAEITSDHDGVRVDIPKGTRALTAAAFPLSIAHYVRRTREKLILDDMTADKMFAADPYLSGARPKSMLCAPIVRRGEVAGILYLENKLVRGAFTPRRLTLLEFLSAISLENALLAADLARETAERTQAERTLRESEERLQRLVETANVVPWEADRATGRFTYVGPQVVKMLGYPQEAWLTEGFLREHAHPDDSESTQLHLMVDAGVDDFDFRVTAADGRTLWLHNIVSTRGHGGSAMIGGFLFDVTERKHAETTLKEKLFIIEEQQAAIQKLSTPIIQVWEGVLTVPVLGVVDERRAEQIMTVVLSEVTRTRSHYAILDLTGVDSVDTRTAEHIMKIVGAVQLLGARSIVVGIRPEVAQTIVSMGVDLSSIVTLANLRQALIMCMKDERVGRARPAWTRR